MKVADIDWDAMFEGSSEEENNKYSEYANTGDGSVQSDNCKTVVTKTKDGVSTETVCSESSESP
jgi:hypothetical protein